MATRRKATTTRKRTKSPPKTNGDALQVQAGSEEELRTLRYLAMGAVAARASIAARMGKSFSDDRDIYTTLGYTKTPSFTDYQSKYYRQEIARAVIDKPVNASWNTPPRISEAESDSDEPTPFEEAWDALAKRLRIWSVFSRVDRLASIGNYAVLLLGFSDGSDLDQEVSRVREVRSKYSDETLSGLIWIQPYNQDNATVSEYEEDPKNERYGKPLYYTVTLAQKGKAGGGSKRVHWSRIIHVALDPLDDDVEGLPRLQAVLNRLQDLDLVTGGSAEMFWRGALPGLGFILPQDAKLGPQTEDDLEDEIEEYVHNLRRFMRLKGLDVKQLSPQVADPANHIDAYLTMISAASEIPKRILVGSERGELASSQDERNWARTVESRNLNKCEPVIIRPFIDRLVRVEAIPQPAGGYNVNWPPRFILGEKERAEVAKLRSEALKIYTDSMDAESTVPEEIFLREFLGLTEEQMERIRLILEAEQEETGTDGGDERPQPAQTEGQPPQPSDTGEPGGGGDSMAEADTAATPAE